MTVSSPVDRTVKMLTRTQATTSLIDTDLSHVQTRPCCERSVVCLFTNKPVVVMVCVAVELNMEFNSCMLPVIKVRTRII